MTTLDLLEQDSAATLKEVKEDIQSVLASKLQIAQKAAVRDQEAETIKNEILIIEGNVEKLKEAKAKALQQGKTALANDKEREIKEQLADVTLKKYAIQAKKQNAAFLAQAGNEMAKVVEVLKDNLLAAKIFFNALRETNSQIRDKLQAVEDVDRATANLASVFQIKDGWKFNVAMNAVTGLIAGHIADIRGNLQLLKENRPVMEGTMSETQLTEFAARIKNGEFKPLNIAEMTSASYDLSDEERVDKTMPSILD